MNREILSVPEVHCDHCVTSIEGAVGALDGVENVTVEIQDRTVAVTYDNSRLARLEIVSAIEQQGDEVNT